MYEELDKTKEALDRAGAEPLDLDNNKHMMAWAGLMGDILRTTLGPERIAEIAKAMEDSEP